MLQLSDGLDFLEKPIGTQHLGQLQSHDLDGDQPVVAQVLGQEHGGHAPGTDLPLDAIAVSEGGGKQRFLVSHSGMVVEG